MSLHREEATTSGRHGRPVCLNVSVVVCDHVGCRETFLLGEGMGDSLSSEDVDALQRAKWASDDTEHDFCPEHAADA